MNKALSGLTVKKLAALVLLLILAGTPPLFAIDVKVTRPEFSFRGGPGGFANFDKIFNEAVKDIFDEIQNEINDEIKDIDANPTKLIGAFANSSVFASDGATSRGYRGYKTFAVTLGPMAGVQLPFSPLSFADEMDNIEDKLEAERDLKLGVNPQVANIQIGINTSKFLLKNLYLGVKFGFMKLDIEDVSFKTFSAGLTGNYQWVPRKSVGFGVLQWRGVNLGTGVIYQRTSLGYDFALDPYEEDITVDNGLGLSYAMTATLKPKLNLDFNINTVTVPLEIMTSVRLLWIINLAFGAGIDLGFGSAKLDVGATADAYVDTKELSQYVTQTKPASLSVSMGGSQRPRFFNPKLMTGLGISLGPVIIDIPVTFYLDNGYNVGVTLGVVW